MFSSKKKDGLPEPSCIAYYLRRNSRIVFLKKSEPQTYYAILSHSKAISHSPHLYLDFYAHLGPLSPTSRGLEMGNQDRSHCFLGNTAFTNPCSAPLAPMTDPLPSFCTLAPSPLPPPTSCVKKILSPPYLKLSSSFCCFLLTFNILIIASKS